MFERQPIQTRVETREYTEELALLEKLLFAAHKNGLKGMAVVERCLDEVRKGGVEVVNAL